MSAGGGGALGLIYGSAANGSPAATGTGTAAATGNKSGECGGAGAATLRPAEARAEPRPGPAPPRPGRRPRRTEPRGVASPGPCGRPRRAGASPGAGRRWRDTAEESPGKFAKFAGGPAAPRRPRAGVEAGCSLPAGARRGMQQTARDEGRHPWQEPLGSVSLPFRCPRCGDHTRFRSLSSLRVHLEYSHSYEERSLLTKSSLFLPLKDAELLSPPEPTSQGSLGSPGSAAPQKGPYLSFCAASCESAKRGQALEVEAERPVSYAANYVSAESPSEQASKPGLPAADSKASFEAHVREKFNRMVEAVDKTIEKRIDKLTKELAQKTAELLEVRAAFVQLSQKKQEVQRRERALSRQVDVAVEMIAALKQRLSESEEELHRKEE